ncbi:protein irs4 [Aspergillus mulundensis]|uniref:Increased rDNA silencing protein 4 n=1 Tax=Aspergillus mulundensis TaxID=1810919 RepID=A0A3D8QMU5_9EURO|nr:Increased rDNA silencing protein 4 [Aspergillus mulundensis]RDW62970.1 Increased rDNA silencing protein 4 [Aspergillus mulundensis]
MAKSPTPSRVVPPRNVNHGTPSATALQGALLAFNHATPPKSHSPMMLADRAPVSLLDSDPDPLPELPEPGSIKDKIQLFSANSTATAPSDRPRSARENVPDITRQKTPQLLAAEIAAGGIHGPNGKTTQRNGVTPSRDLPSPVPVRKPLVKPRLLEPYEDDTRELSLPKPSLDQRPASSGSSTFPRPPITKPRPVPPPIPRKPSPAVSEAISNSVDRHSENRPQYDESRKPPLPLRSKASAATLSEGRPPALPPRRAATAQDVYESSVIQRRSKSTAIPSTPSTVSLYSQSQNASRTSMLTNMGRDAPSDAVAASSLASNRALKTRTSPPPPPPARRRRSRSRSLLHIQHQHKKDRTPNPSPGGLRETLRPQAKSDDEGDQRRRQHKNRIINKHPHKHNEGDRRRWRSELTEKERKRYEGVWAANKGLLLHPSQILDQNIAPEKIPPGMYPPAAMDMVVNLVVRDIWSRSRLPDHVLERVWDLVDGQNNGMLTRAEFVVGMWLIDQQLRGHKLPAVVPDSVWASVIRVPGISLESHYTKH